ncbi:amino acid permease [Xylanibacillus composti]|nr:amino acid permease [Xylanibacillus composti]MDT9724494.1 amino acid permease [Xylanibacillus composti]
MSVGEHKKGKGHLSWWGLALLGLGFTTGTGFFLGSSIAIEKSGFSILLLFLIAAVCTYFVFDALANMIAQHAEEGSFRTYSKKAFGRWSGFSHGWMYWSSEILILGSQLTAIGLFTRFWFSDTPLWLLTAIYALLGVVIVLFGTAGFEKAENVFAIVKVSAIVLFIALALLVIPGVLGKENAHIHEPQSMDHFFTGGAMGMWTALIYVFFAFAGIEVMGLMAAELKQPKEAPKSGKVMLTIITILYVASMGLTLLLAPLDKFNTNESPFVTALKDLKFTPVVHVFNGVLIIAGFSSLVASLFAVTQMMANMAKTGDAPKLLSKRTKRKLPYASLLLTIGGMIVSIITALVLPDKVFEYLTTAGGLMLLYSWLFIVFASRKLLKLTAWGQIKTIIAVAMILLAAAGTLFDKISRPGFFISLGFLVVLGAVTWIMTRRWKREEEASEA